MYEKFFSTQNALFLHCNFSRSVVFCVYVCGSEKYLKKCAYSSFDSENNNDNNNCTLLLHNFK